MTISAVPRTARRVRNDRVLVERCLSGEPAAWTNLYRACHEQLLAAIRSFLRDAAVDDNLVDEIAARVWYTVVRNNGELLSRFDAARGCRLTTFLTVIAKTEARQYFRGERRRRAHEETASRREADLDPLQTQSATATEQEFLATLTPTERVFYESVLKDASRRSVEEDYSAENFRKLRQRVRKKLHLFLNQAF